MAAAYSTSPEVVVQRKVASHLPSLDGLRAASILMVIWGHACGTRGFEKLGSSLRDLAPDLARLGVMVFFVISGFLITSLLTAEYAQTGRVSLKLFYARRALRIFPASFAYLGVLLILSALGLIALKPGNLWAAITYTVNYVPVPRQSWQIAHLWSLSIEEQFYLMWPVAFVMAGPRRAVWVAAAVIAFAPVARGVERLLLIGTDYNRFPTFPVVADSLASGCLLGLVRKRLEWRSGYQRLLHPIAMFGTAALVFWLNAHLVNSGVWIFGTSVMNLGIALLIHRCVLHPQDVVGRLLNWRPVAWIGTLSYSLYIWQELFLDHRSAAWANAFPQNVFLAAGAALTSYTLLERPLMRLRERLH